MVLPPGIKRTPTPFLAAKSRSRRSRRDSFDRLRGRAVDLIALCVPTCRLRGPSQKASIVRARCRRSSDRRPNTLARSAGRSNGTFRSSKRRGAHAGSKVVALPMSKPPGPSVDAGGSARLLYQFRADSLSIMRSPHAGTRDDHLCIPQPVGLLAPTLGASVWTVRTRPRKPHRPTSAAAFAKALAWRW